MSLIYFLPTQLYINIIVFTASRLEIVYYIIIGQDLIVQLVLIADYKHNALEWDGTITPTK